MQENTYTVQNASKPFSPNSHLVGWCSKDSCRGTVFIQFLNWLQIRLISSEHLPIVFHWWATSSYPTRLCNWMKIELLHLHSSLNVSPATFLRERKRAEKKKQEKNRWMFHANATLIRERQTRSCPKISMRRLTFKFFPPSHRVASNTQIRTIQRQWQKERNRKRDLFCYPVVDLYPDTRITRTHGNNTHQLKEPPCDLGGFNSIDSNGY